MYVYYKTYSNKIFQIFVEGSDKVLLVVLLL